MSVSVPSTTAGIPPLLSPAASLACQNYATTRQTKKFQFKTSIHVIITTHESNLNNGKNNFIA